MGRACSFSKRTATFHIGIFFVSAGRKSYPSLTSSHTAPWLARHPVWALAAQPNSELAWSFAPSRPKSGIPGHKSCLAVVSDPEGHDRCRAPPRFFLSATRHRFHWLAVPCSLRRDARCHRARRSPQPRVQRHSRGLQRPLPRRCREWMETPMHLQTVSSSGLERD